MRTGGGEFDVCHPLPPDLGLNHLHAAFLTNDAPVFHSLVLATVTFVVLCRPENLGAEKTVSFRLKRSIIDGFGLFNLSMRPF